MPRVTVVAPLLALLLTANSPPAAGQAGDAPSSGISPSGEIILFLSDVGAYLVSPLHFTGSDWLGAGAVIGGTALVMGGDQRIQRNVSHQAMGEYNHDFWDIPTFYGSTAFALSASALTYAGGAAAGNDDVRVTGRLMLTSLASAEVVVTVLKFVTGRGRPSDATDQWHFRWFERDDAHHSFPSGHTAAAFSISTVLAERIDRTWARMLFYGAAALTGYARVRNNRHWASDVVMGAAIGVTAGLHALAREDDRTSGAASHGTGLRISPALSGVSVSYWY